MAKVLREVAELASGGMGGGGGTMAAVMREVADAVSRPPSLDRDSDDGSGDVDVGEAGFARGNGAAPAADRERERADSEAFWAVHQNPWGEEIGSDALRGVFSFLGARDLCSAWYVPCTSVGCCRARASDTYRDCTQPNVEVLEGRVTCAVPMAPLVLAEAWGVQAGGAGASGAPPVAQVPPPCLDACIMPGVAGAHPVMPFLAAPFGRAFTADPATSRHSTHTSSACHRGLRSTILTCLGA